MVGLGIDNTYTIERMRTLILHPEYEGEAYEWWIAYPHPLPEGMGVEDNETLLSTERDLIFCQAEAGTYHLRLEIHDEYNPINHSFTIVVFDEEVAYSPYISRVFEYNPAPGQFVNVEIAGKFLRKLGLLPAYRMSHEGYAAINKNRETFDAAGQALCDGETLMLFPEADHQDKRWLGNFKIGYLRIAFEAAEKFNFERDVMILPSCNHYSNYFHARTDMLIKFGQPISLKPYYEQYKESPRETMIQINQIVRDKIQEMMLHIDDLNHYEQIDFLRDNGYGRKYAIEHGFKFRYLPSRLISDQKLVSALERAYKQHPEQMEQSYSDTSRLIEGQRELKIRDWLFIHNPGIEAPLLRGLGLLLLLPLFLVSALPTLLLFVIPKIFLKKLIKDQMFYSSFNVGVSVFVSVPLCHLLPSALLWIFAGHWWALGYFVAFPLMFILAWNFIRMFLKFVGSCRFVAPKNKAKITELSKLRKSVFDRLDKIIEQL